jgi:hypothetical protein
MLAHSSSPPEMWPSSKLGYPIETPGSLPASIPPSLVSLSDQLNLDLDLPFHNSRGATFRRQ